MKQKELSKTYYDDIKLKNLFGFHKSESKS